MLEGGKKNQEKARFLWERNEKTKNNSIKNMKLLTDCEETHFKLNKCDQNTFKTISKWSSLKSRVLMPGVMGVNITRFPFQVLKRSEKQFYNACIVVTHDLELS